MSVLILPVKTEIFIIHASKEMAILCLMSKTGVFILFLHVSISYIQKFMTVSLYHPDTHGLVYIQFVFLAFHLKAIKTLFNSIFN